MIKCTLSAFLLFTGVLGWGQSAPPSLLPIGTRVSLEPQHDLSHEDLVEGKIIDLRVRMAVVVEGDTLIHEGAYAEGMITEHQPPRSFGRAEQVTLEAISVQTVDNQIIPIQGQPYRQKGKGRAEKAIGFPAVVAVGGLFLATPAFIPAIGLGIFIKGSPVVLDSHIILEARVPYNTKIFL